MGGLSLALFTVFKMCRYNVNTAKEDMMAIYEKTFTMKIQLTLSINLPLL